MNLPLEKVSKIPRGALTNVTFQISIPHISTYNTYCTLFRQYCTKCAILHAKIGPVTKQNPHSIPWDREITGQNNGRIASSGFLCNPRLLKRWRLYIFPVMHFGPKSFKKANECLLKDRRKAEGRFVYSAKFFHHWWSCVIFIQ